MFKEMFVLFFFFGGGTASLVSPDKPPLSVITYYYAVYRYFLFLCYLKILNTYIIGNTIAQIIL
jgi:hypothetical protein